MKMWKYFDGERALVNTYECVSSTCIAKAVALMVDKEEKRPYVIKSLFIYTLGMWCLLCAYVSLRVCCVWISANLNQNVRDGIKGAGFV
jgi:hypothetical protein